ncbi:hypothetical protein OHA25_39540 [Nonomuraea sp. NBC_00507]|uniref:hypothetical protein n=1 Tax=Nonomuraea sp. NBC_00507 TaxID=2976002 RepID=UPI002E18FB16
MDHTATTREQVKRLTRECLAVADGAVPRPAVTRFLADLRDELGTIKEFDGLQWLWRDQLARMLGGVGVAGHAGRAHAGPLPRQRRRPRLVLRGPALPDLHGRCLGEGPT